MPKNSKTKQLDSRTRLEEILLAINENKRQGEHLLSLPASIDEQLAKAKSNLEGLRNTHAPTVAHLAVNPLSDVNGLSARF